MNWILNRLKERSTWSALITLSGLIGINLKPELTEAIITAGTAIVALIFAVTEDKPSMVVNNEFTTSIGSEQTTGTSEAKNVDP